MRRKFLAAIAMTMCAPAIANQPLIRDPLIDYMLCSAYYAGVGEYWRNEKNPIAATIADQESENFAIFSGSLAGLKDRKQMEITVLETDALARRMRRAINSAEIKKRYDVAFGSLCTDLAPVVKEMVDKARRSR